MTKSQTDASGAQALGDWLMLADRCEKAAGPDTALDLAIRDACGLEWKADHLRFSASLDAAMTLVPEGWWVSKLTQRKDRTRTWVTLFAPGSGPIVDGAGPTDALALCAAALRARGEPS